MMTMVKKRNINNPFILEHKSCDRRRCDSVQCCYDRRAKWNMPQHEHHRLAATIDEVTSLIKPKYEMNESSCNLSFFLHNETSFSYMFCLLWYIATIIDPFILLFLLVRLSLLRSKESKSINLCNALH